MGMVLSSCDPAWGCSLYLLPLSKDSWVRTPHSALFELNFLGFSWFGLLVLLNYVVSCQYSFFFGISHAFPEHQVLNMDRFTHGRGQKTRPGLRTKHCTEARKEC